MEINELRAKTRERLWSSLTVLASAGVAAIATLRLLSVSRFDASTALGVLGATTTATIVFGAAVIAIPYIAAMITAQLGNSANSSVGYDRRTLWARYAIGAFFVLLFAPPVYLITVAIPLVFAGIEFVVRRRRRRKKHRQVPDTSWLRTKKPLNDRILNHYREEYIEVEKHQKNIADLSGDEVRALTGRLSEIAQDGNDRLAKIYSSGRAGMESATVAAVAAFLPVVIQYIGTADRPWIPAEILRTQGNVQTVGYVVKQDVRWSTILREPDRSIQIVATPDILSRTICTVGKYSDDQRPAVARFSTQAVPQYPACPGLEKP